MEITELAPWLTWGFPIIGALLTPVFAALGEKVRDYMAVVFSFLAALAATLMLFTYTEPHVLEYPWIPSLGVTFAMRVDPLSVFMANVVSWISFLIMVYSLGYMAHDPDRTRYWFFMNYFIGNMLLLVLADNLLVTFIAWEGVGLCSYQLIGFWYTDENRLAWVGDFDEMGRPKKVFGVDMTYPPSHAGMKAFVMTRVGDVGFLIGILSLFLATGTFNLSKIEEALIHSIESGHGDPLHALAAAGFLLPAALLILGGPVGKSAQFPLHEWLPDAMTGPTSVSALIHAATMVKAGVYFVARFSPIVFMSAYLLGYGQLRLFFEAVAWIGALTAFIAATQAMVAREVKKVLAYSTVSQIGYMMLGLGVAGLMADFIVGYFSGLFHLMSHAIFKASLFLAAGALIHAAETRYMDEMGGLKDKMKYTWAAMMLAGLSLAGMPFFSGFWSKDAILAASLEAGQVPLFVLGVVTAGITAFYTFRMLGVIFWGEKSHHLEEIEHHHGEIHEAPPVMWIPYSILAVSSLVIGIAAPLGFEKMLHGFLAEPLEHLVEAVHLEAAEAVVGLDPHVVAMASSIAMFLIGVGFGYYGYISRRIDVKSLVDASGLLKGLQKFFYNRWYINPAYYKVFINGTLWVARGVRRFFERLIIDGFYHTFLPLFTLLTAFGLYTWFEMAVIDKINDAFVWGGTKFSNALRRIHLGVLQEYIFAIAIGLSFLALYLLMFLR